MWMDGWRRRWVDDEGPDAQFGGEEAGCRLRLVSTSSGVSFFFFFWQRGTVVRF